jgi:predicted nucleic acid-binding protein
MTLLLTAPEAVLDTQSVLDWLYFSDPVCAAWEPARQSGAWQAVCSSAMRAELVHVLGRMHLPGCTPERGEQLLALFDARVRPVPEVTELGLARPLCRDPDDQKFIDLALARRTRWLVSRDKAVLKLRSRVLRVAAVQVLPPAAWSAQLAAQACEAELV